MPRPRKSSSVPPPDAHLPDRIMTLTRGILRDFGVFIKGFLSVKPKFSKVFVAASWHVPSSTLCQRLYVISLRKQQHRRRRETIAARHRPGPPGLQVVCLGPRVISAWKPELYEKCSLLHAHTCASGFMATLGLSGNTIDAAAKKSSCMMPSTMGITLWHVGAIRLYKGYNRARGAGTHCHICQLCPVTLGLGQLISCLARTSK